jgi:hypothetical protein
MKKTPSERVRDAEAKRLALGQRQIRLWLPDDPSIIEEFRKAAKEACNSKGA